MLVKFIAVASDIKRHNLTANFFILGSLESSYSLFLNVPRTLVGERKGREIVVKLQWKKTNEINSEKKETAKELTDIK